VELKILRHEKELFGRKWAFEVGKVAWQADSAVWAQCGDTVVLVTVVVSKKPAEGVDFLPLAVHYEEKMYAAGKIPGGFIKREGKPSDHEVLVARLIDRPIRPLIPNTLRHEVQIIATVLSADPEVSPDIVAMNGASLALCLSGLPFDGPIGAVRVGLEEDGFVANPPYSQIENGELNLVVVAKEPDKVVMIEAGAREIPEDKMLEAVRFGRDIGLEMIAFQKEFIELYKEKFGEVPKLELTFEEPPEDLVEEIEKEFGQEIFNAIYVKVKKEREMAIDAVKEKVAETIKERYGEEDERTKLAPQAFSKVVKKIFRKRVLEENVRPDGRKDTDSMLLHS
jgi:polyribonucleotide nucleotidyltransferase